MRTEVFVASVLLAASGAFAQDAAPPEVAPAAEPAAGAAPAPAADEPVAGEQPTLSFSRPEWTVQAEPMVWYVSPSGEIRMPSPRFQIETDLVRVERLNLDSPLVTPAGTVQFRADKWRFGFSGMTYNADRNFAADSTFVLGDLPVARGEDVDVDFDFFSAEVTAGYRVYERDFFGLSGKPEGGARFQLDVHAFGGARVYDFGLSVENESLGGADAGAAVSTDLFFAEPIVGALFELEIAGDFSISVQLSGGAMPLEDHSSYSLDIAVGFRWRPHPNVGVLIGWRQLGYSLSDGDGGESWEKFEYDGQMAGVFGGVTIRF